MPLSASDVGQRVVVRRRLGVEYERPVYGDVLGILESWSAGQLRVRRRDGVLVEIAETDVVAGKPVPPPPPSRFRSQNGPDEQDHSDDPDTGSDPAAEPDQPHTGPGLARVSASGWPATTVEPLGEWLLQAAGGFTGRANSVLPSGDPGLPLDEALARVSDFYARAGLPAWIQVIVDSPLEEELRRRGWRIQSSGKGTFDTTDVRVAPLADLLARTEEPPVQVALGRDLDDAWLAMYGRSGRQDTARQIITGPEHVALARVTAAAANSVAALAASSVATHGGSPSGSDPATELVGIARGVVTGTWLGVGAVEVAADRRRQGLARAIMAGLGRWGRECGATWVYLQVGTDNAAALALYDRLGFRLDHQYCYYSAPRSTS
ncbi:GNAT family N-acetyltransferase [Actinopolymorpha pittospori]|uniref:GNAT family N-acetyltransferase n=1 Tax=Actinopolymorpha pittospori TaxID=648752 RepID=UPI003B586A9C